eukprot:gnl/MRDRNA2_/MRDRNA2_133513_c0_seq1.p1 gnl/MRDRNA2_/MRDRNA2_133513_c0~~gnl/MRDRNA2_/MRDRNA2_133513_c0_seq1.p1  ORF type:complete len:379 (+),score=61.15 gnl/MRDRNA2_/MRDRNA2_133513_c0_seq1:92-1228(+)
MVHSVFLAALSLVGSDAVMQQHSRLRISNGCMKEPIWIAHEAAGGVGPDAQNTKIAAGSSHDFTILDGMSATRYWPKMRCDEQGNHCALGGSGGPSESCDPVHGCAPPVDTKFEATWGVVGQPCNQSAKENKGCDYFDTSLVDGFTLPFKMIIGGDCSAALPKPLKHPEVLDCSALSIDACPTSENLGAAGSDIDLRIVKPGSQEVVGCYAPCSKLTFQQWGNTIADHHTPGDSVAGPYCCPTPPVSPSSCRTGPVATTQYVQMVHKKCPGVYGYSYDDGIGLRSCPAGTQYEMVFYCPSSSPSPSPPPSPPSPPPSPSAHCKVGDVVNCPGNSRKCAGDECCPDGSTCPSADSTYKMCPRGKTTDCTKWSSFQAILV